MHLTVTRHGQLASCSRPVISSASHCRVAVQHKTLRPKRMIPVVHARQHGDDVQGKSGEAASKDIQPEQPEVVYTEKQLDQGPPDTPNPSESGKHPHGDHHLDNIVYKTAHEAQGNEGQSGRFDEEPFMPDQPYSPKPSKRGHGVPPHKDESNTRAPDRTE